MLKDELEALGLSARAFADHLKVPHNRVSDIIAGRRAITADTSLRLGRFFGMSEDFWLRLQTTYEIKRAKEEFGKRILGEVRPLRRRAA